MVSRHLTENIPVIVLSCFTILTVVAVYIRAGIEALGASVPMLVFLAVYIVQRILKTLRTA